MVGQTSDGQEAIQMVQDRSPDILVMDLVLGRMDGFDVLDAVKSKPVSTLILSGFAGAAWPIRWPPGAETTT